MIDILLILFTYIVIGMLCYAYVNVRMAVYLKEQENIWKN
jgi:hypothetical protein